METFGPGEDVSMINERRRTQNRLAQRRRRHKLAFERQAAPEQTSSIHAGLTQPDAQAGAELPSPSDMTSGLEVIDSFLPFAGSDMALLDFSPTCNDDVSTLVESHPSAISSAHLLGAVADADLAPPPSTWSFETPEAARLAAMAFSRTVVPRPNPTFSNNRNETLIHTAARGNDVATLQLLAQAGLNVNERDLQGRTALHSAYEEHQMEAILWLLEQGVNVNAMDKMGRTALSMAVNNKCPVAVRLMLSHGASPFPTQIEQAWALSTSTSMSHG